MTGMSRPRPPTPWLHPEAEARYYREREIQQLAEAEREWSDARQRRRLLFQVFLAFVLGVAVGILWSAR